MRAYEMRFPTCDMIPIIKETEIIEQDLSADKAVHMVDRRAKLNVEAPYLLKKLMGVEFLLFRQRNTTDLRARTLHIEAWNESFDNRVEINEYCVYSVHPENPDWTCFEQSAELDIKNFFGFEGTAEKLAIKEYSKSIEKSKDIMEHFIKLLYEQGITKLDVWVEPPVGINTVVETEPEESSDKPKVGGDKLRRKSSAKGRDLEQSLTDNQDPASKLEQDYIQMFLGKLEPMQESRLVQLKQCMNELQKGKTPPDPVVLRFLRARDFNVEKGREMLSSSLIWRKKHGVDKILFEYQVCVSVWSSLGLTGTASFCFSSVVVISQLFVRLGLGLADLICFASVIFNIVRLGLRPFQGRKLGWTKAEHLFLSQNISRTL